MRKSRPQGQYRSRKKTRERKRGKMRRGRGERVSHRDSTGARGRKEEEEGRNRRGGERVNRRTRK